MFSNKLLAALALALSLLSAPVFGQVPMTGAGRGTGVCSITDSDATALIAAMSSAPDSTRQCLIQTTITCMKSAGSWSGYDVLYFMAAHDSQASTLNWKNPGGTALSYNAGITFTANLGVTGNGTTGVVTTGFVPSAGVNFQQDNAQVSTFVSGIGTGTAEVTRLSAVPPVTMNVSTGGNFNGRINSTSTSTTTAVAGNQFISVQRAVAGTQSLRRNGAGVLNSSLASSARDGSALTLLGTSSAWSTDTLSLFSAGASISGEAANYTCIRNYMTAVGIP